MGGFRNPSLARGIARAMNALKFGFKILEWGIVERKQRVYSFYAKPKTFGMRHTNAEYQRERLNWY